MSTASRRFRCDALKTTAKTYRTSYVGGVSPVAERVAAAKVTAAGMSFGTLGTALCNTAYPWQLKALVVTSFSTTSRHRLPSRSSSRLERSHERENHKAFVGPEVRCLVFVSQYSRSASVFINASGPSPDTVLGGPEPKWYDIPDWINNSGLGHIRVAKEQFHADLKTLREYGGVPPDDQQIDAELRKTPPSLPDVKVVAGS
jgi:hypothetical protein